MFLTGNGIHVLSVLDEKRHCILTDDDTKTLGMICYKLFARTNSEDQWLILIKENVPEGVFFLFLYKTHCVDNAREKWKLLLQLFVKLFVTAEDLIFSGWYQMKVYNYDVLSKVGLDIQGWLKIDWCDDTTLIYYGRMPLYRGNT